jgi:hypothetical protein
VFCEVLLLEAPWCNSKFNAQRIFAIITHVSPSVARIALSGAVCHFNGFYGKLGEDNAPIHHVDRNLIKATMGALLLTGEGNSRRKIASPNNKASVKKNTIDIHPVNLCSAGSSV